jgi:hypothetical protein
MLDFHGALAYRYYEWFGESLGPFLEWDDILRLTHFESWHKLWEWCDRANVWHNLPWIPGAPGAIDKLLWDGHQIAFVTARDGGGAAAAQTWWASGPWALNPNTSIHTNLGNRKHAVKCSVYVDDSPGVLQALADEALTAIRFEKPWNAHMKVKRSAKDWQKVLDIIAGMKT